MDAVFLGGVGVMRSTEADAGEASVAASWAGLAAENAEPVDGAVLVGVEAELDEAVEMRSFSSGVQCAEEGVLFFTQPWASWFDVVAH